MHIIERWRWPQSTNIILDAGFSSKSCVLFLCVKYWTYLCFVIGIELLQFIQDGRMLVTASMNVNHKRWLFDLLYHYCIPRHWICVQEKSGLLWSLQKSEKGEAAVVVWWQCMCWWYVDTKLLPQKGSISLQHQHSSLLSSVMIFNIFLFSLHLIDSFCPRWVSEA